MGAITLGKVLNVPGTNRLTELAEGAAHFNRISKVKKTANLGVHGGAVASVNV